MHHFTRRLRTCLLPKPVSDDTTPSRPPPIKKIEMECYATHLGLIVAYCGSPWLTGHCFLQRHNHLLQPLPLQPLPHADCGWEQETSSHIICEFEVKHGHLIYYRLEVFYQVYFHMGK